MPLRVPGSRPTGSGVFSDATWKQVADQLGLHGRMLDVVQGIFDGKTEYAIAFELHLSRHTIHTYLQRIRYRLAARTRVEIVLAVTREVISFHRPGTGASSLTN